MKITVKEAKRLIQGRINACQNYDDERLLDTIHLAQERAWNSGKWYGMMDRMVVRVMSGRIVLPSDYGVLQAINYLGVPKMIHPIWYEFSPNGPGTRECWEHRGIFDLQNVPTLYKIIKGERVIAISKSKNGEDQGTLVTIQGRNSDGNIIYRYDTKEDCGEPVKDSDLGEQIKVGMVDDNGNPLPAYQTYNDFAEDGITNIFKPQTRGPIEIHAVGPRYTRILTTLQPKQTQSNLRAYRVPEGCGCGKFVEILARKAQPERPHQDSEVIQIESPDALINLAMSVYYAFDTFEPEKSEWYLSKGLLALNGNLQENLGTSQSRPQVWVGASYARDNRRNWRAR